MSNFYGNLTNPKMPEVVMNAGPLPPLSTDGLPYGLNGTADARINATGQLLSGVQPYVYGDSDRLSTQTSYLNVPYRIQKIVPEIFLPPMSEGSTLVKISHPVDYGDVAFAVRFRNVSNVLGVHLKSAEGTSDNGTHITAFVNLPTANYILVGFQKLFRTVRNALNDPGTAFRPDTSFNGNDRAWLSLWADIFGVQLRMEGSNGFLQWYTDQVDRKLVTMVMKLFPVFVPFGVCAGSEKQGGMHEAGMSPVMWAVNHVTSMNVEGLTRDMINYWRHLHINSGDRIGFRLMPVDLADPSRPVAATLNHFPKGLVRMEFQLPHQLRTMTRIGPALGNREDMPEYFLIVPDTYPFKIPLEALSNRCADPDYKRRYKILTTHWYIGTTQQHYPQMKSIGEMGRFLKDDVFMTGGLLQTTISPRLMHYRDNHQAFIRQLDTAVNVGDIRVLRTEFAGGRKRPFEIGASGASLGANSEAPRRRFALPPPKTLGTKESEEEPAPKHEEPKREKLDSLIPENITKPKKQVARPLAGKKAVAVSMVE